MRGRSRNDSREEWPRIVYSKFVNRHLRLLVARRSSCGGSCRCLLVEVDRVLLSSEENTGQRLRTVVLLLSTVASVGRRSLGGFDSPGKSGYGFLAQIGRASCRERGES